MKTLKQIFDEGGHAQGTGDKGTVHSYIPYLYDKLLQPYREQGGISLLEIGIGKGYSLQTWKEYFTDYACGVMPCKIVGIDIDIDNQLDTNDKAFQFIDMFQGSATDEVWVKKTLGNEKFDVIIDDGSHNVNDQIASFDILFNEYLKVGGIYAIEDVNDSDRLFEFFKSRKSPYFFFDGRTFKQRSDDCAFFVYKYE